MVIFRLFKMAAAAMLDFRNMKFLTFVTVKRVELHVPNFVEIVRTATYVSFNIMLVFTLCMQNLLTHLNPDWINSGVIRKLFMIIVPKFKELEVEVKFIRNCLDNCIVVFAY